MKKLLLILLFVLLAFPAYAVVVPTRVSGGTVTYSTIDHGTPQVVTFNSITKHIIMWNESVHADCYVDLKCRDAGGKTGLITPENAIVKLPAAGTVTPNVIEIDFATWNLGFVSRVDSALPVSQIVTYIVTGERGDL